MRSKLLFAASSAMLLALPAIAQQLAPAQPAPGLSSQGAAAPSPSTTDSTGNDLVSSDSGTDETAVQEVARSPSEPPAPPVEFPGWARRDPWTAGAINPADVGLTTDAWGGARGPFLSILLRRMQTPLASRWAHIALRNALIAKIRAPGEIHPVDWTAERAWLLLRLGEADAARMLVAGVDTDRFTPKMVQVAVQTALANADPPALCPLEDGIRRYDPAVLRLVQAMCASLAGQSDQASAMVDQARRYGRIGGIDLALTEKVVGAGANGRASTIEWDPVDSLTAWRFGLAAGTGVIAPDRLMSASPVQLRAFAARAPLLTAQQRLPSALIAAGLGVFSSQTLTDLYSSIYDSTDPSDLPTTDAWQLRQAFVAKDGDARLESIRKLLGSDKGGLEREAARALVARAATLVTPDAKYAKDAPDLIASMLAGGYDQAAARWIPALARMDNEEGDRCWAMLALAAPTISDVGASRLNSFIKKDKSRDHERSALLVAGLAGLGRISADTANNLNQRYGLGLVHSTSWTRVIDDAAARGEGGTVLVLAGTGLQTSSFDRVPAAHLYHIVSALNRTGQGFTARMIAAEALSRT